MTITVEVTPKIISVIENGNIDKAEPVITGLVVSWYRPNGLNNQMTGEVSGIKLRGAEEYTDFPLVSPKEILKNQILKTDVVGDSVIKVELIVAKEPGSLNKIFSVLFGAAVGLINISNPFASAIVGLAKSDIQTSINSKQVYSLGQGFFLCDSNNMPSIIKVKLTTTKAIEALPDDEFDEDYYGDDLVELMAANKDNGYVTLSLKTIS